MHSKLINDAENYMQKNPSKYTQHSTISFAWSNQKLSILTNMQGPLLRTNFNNTLLPT